MSGTALKINEEINACVNERYIFAANLKATKAGSAQWNWIRWDGGTSGSNGTVTFDVNGDPIAGPNAYTLTIAPYYDLTGWMALQVNWSGGSFTTNQAAFTYTASQVFPPGC